MTDKYYAYKDIPKMARNGMASRIDAAVKKYGFEVFRKCTLKYIDEVKKYDKLQQEIDDKEEELSKLKKQKH